MRLINEVTKMLRNLRPMKETIEEQKYTIEEQKYFVHGLMYGPRAYAGYEEALKFRTMLYNQIKDVKINIEMVSNGWIIKTDFLDQKGGKFEQVGTSPSEIFDMFIDWISDKTYLSYNGINYCYNPSNHQLEGLIKSI